jgi:predicted nucleotidyltransferase
MSFCSETEFTSRLQSALHKCLLDYLNTGTRGVENSTCAADYAKVIERAVRTKRWAPSLKDVTNRLRKLCDENVGAASQSISQSSSFLVDCYRIFENLVSRQVGGVQQKVVKIRKVVNQTTYSADIVYLIPVLKLASFSANYLKSWTKAVLLHGSLATLDYAKDYSDLDTVIIISKRAFSSGSVLGRFRKFYRRSLSYLYWFDPLQHHGHIVFTEWDLNWYSENLLPIVVFENARSLTGEPVDICFSLRDSTSDGINEFARVVSVFKDRAINSYVPRDPWSAKSFLSELMLLPSIYCQVLGERCDKKTSFGTAKNTLSPNKWSVMDEATEIRLSWRYHRKSNLAPEIAVKLNLDPWIIRRLSSNPKSAVLDRLPIKIDKLFVQRAAKLADAMLEVVKEQSLKLKGYPPKKKVRFAKEEITDLQLTHLPYNRSLTEYRATIDRFLEKAARINAVKAVYQFGSIGAPGLSDIDLALVVKDDINSQELSQLSIGNLGEVDRENFLHETAILTEETQDILFKAQYIKKLVKIYGEDAGLRIREGLPDTSERRALTLETAPTYICCLQKWLALRNVDVAWSFPVLRSVKYLMELNPDLKQRFSGQWADYLDNVAFLCDNWFGFSDMEAALICESVLRKAWEVVVDILWALDAELAVKKQFTEGREMKKSGSMKYSSSERVVVEKEKPINSVNVQNSFFVYPFPPSCLHMLDVYQTQGGLLAESLEKLFPACWSGLEPATEFEVLLAERAKIINQHIEFLESKNSDFGQIISGFVYNPSLNKTQSSELPAPLLQRFSWKVLWLLSVARLVLKGEKYN